MYNFRGRNLISSANAQIFKSAAQLAKFGNKNCLQTQMKSSLTAGMKHIYVTELSRKMASL